MGEVNQSGWHQLINEDLAWVRARNANNSSLEGRHVIQLLEWCKWNMTLLRDNPLKLNKEFNERTGNS